MFSVDLPRFSVQYNSQNTYEIIPLNTVNHLTLVMETVCPEDANEFSSTI